MNDATTTVAQLKERTRAFAAERAWDRVHTPKNVAMALAAEAGELLALFLWVESEASRGASRDPERYAAACDELADVFIYGLEFANAAGIDVSAAIASKIAKNAARFPRGAVGDRTPG